MIVIAIWVMALVLLALGLWHIAVTLYETDLYCWNLFHESHGELTEIIISGQVVDTHSYLIERAVCGGAITVIAIGFLYIAYRLSFRRH